MSEKQKLAKILWDIANKLRGSMDADDFRDYILGFLFLKYISDNYENTAKSLLKEDYPQNASLQDWYTQNPTQTELFEQTIQRTSHYIIKPQYLWSNIVKLAKTQDINLLQTLEEGFKHIEDASLNTQNQKDNTFNGLFSEIRLSSEKLGRNNTERNKKLSEIISTIHNGLPQYTTEQDQLGDAYEYLISQFSSSSGKKAGEFYTPQTISSILSKIVTLDCQKPELGKKKQLSNILDFACGSGSLLLNVSKEMNYENIGMIYGQEKNNTTYNLARMNMLLHGLKSSEFTIFNGDTLTNDWNILNEKNPSKKIEFDAIVANPPFSYSWKPSTDTQKDYRFADYGVAPKSSADFAFLLHGFHYLSSTGTMAIILPHGVLFRSGVEEKIRTKLLQDGNIDTIIGLPSNLFYSTGIPVCIIILKKCKKANDVLFINASEHFEKGKKQNTLRESDIQKIIDTYIYRKEEERYSRKVSLEEIEKNDFNLNISRYIDMSVEEEELNLNTINTELYSIEEKITQEKSKLNTFLEELGLKPLP